MKVGVPFEGQYEEILNTELKEYGGTWDYSQNVYQTKDEMMNGKDFSLEVTIPPLSVLIIKPKRIKGAK